MIHLFFLPILLLVLLPLAPYFSAWEGRMFPVASKARILQIVPAADGGSLIRMVWEKTRACEFKHLNWNRILPDGTLEAVKVTWTTDIGDRAPGRHLGQTWHVAMPPEQIEGKSLAYVWHDCHPGFLTISQFYP
jgi:hypothetical protein